LPLNGLLVGLYRVSDWPNQAEDSKTFTIAADGLCEVPRGTSRYARPVGALHGVGKSGGPLPVPALGGRISASREAEYPGQQYPDVPEARHEDKVPESVISLIETWGQAGARVRHYQPDDRAARADG